MSHKRNVGPKDLAALMERIEQIEILMPAKPVNTATGKIMDYQSHQFRHIEELIGFCRTLECMGEDNVERIRHLKQQLSIARSNTQRARRALHEVKKYHKNKNGKVTTEESSTWTSSCRDSLKRIFSG